VLRDVRKESAVPFLERALAWFAGYGVTVAGHDRQQLGLSQPPLAAGTRHPLSCATSAPNPTPRAPTVKAERLIQTSLREWAYAQAYTSSQARQYALADWLGHYDTARPHTSLASRPPATRLGQNPFLGLIKGAVPSSRPGSSRSLHEGSMLAAVNNVLGNDN
jgi:hypothetical protein